MKTYIVLTSKGFVAVQATSKKSAHSKVVQNGYSANKGSVTVSACHIDYVSCDKI